MKVQGPGWSGLLMVGVGGGLAWDGELDAAAVSGVVGLVFLVVCLVNFIGPADKIPALEQAWPYVFDPAEGVVHHDEVLAWPTFPAAVRSSFEAEPVPPIRPPAVTQIEHDPELAEVVRFGQAEPVRVFHVEHPMTVEGSMAAMKAVRDYLVNTHPMELDMTKKPTTYLYAIQDETGREVTSAKVETAKVSDVKAEFERNGTDDDRVLILHGGKVVANELIGNADEVNLTLHRWNLSDKLARPVSKPVR